MCLRHQPNKASTACAKRARGYRSWGSDMPLYRIYVYDGQHHVKRKIETVLANGEEAMVLSRTCCFQQDSEGLEQYGIVGRIKAFAPRSRKLQGLWKWYRGKVDGGRIEGTGFSLSEGRQLPRSDFSAPVIPDRHLTPLAAEAD